MIEANEGADWLLSPLASIYVAVSAAILAAIVASGHAILYKRDSRGAMLWVGLVWFAPLLGPLLYFGFGINRIKRRAILLRRERPDFTATSAGVRSDDDAGHERF